MMDNLAISKDKDIEMLRVSCTQVKETRREERKPDADKLLMEVFDSHSVPSHAV